jgi:glutaredoxin
MPIIESVFRTLERVDATVTRVRNLVKGEREAPRDESPTQPAASKPRVDEPQVPLGDPAIAVQVYGRVTDPWTGRTTLLLRDRQIDFRFVELDAKENERLAPRLETETRQRITPYVFIRGAFIGGYNALDEIDRLGQLEERVKSPEERAKSPDRGIKIEVQARGPEDAPPGER